MYKKSKKLHYTWCDFEEDVKEIVEYFDGFDSPHVVGIHRGSLPLAVKLSNIFNNGMSIYKFQTYGDNNDKMPISLLHEFPSEGPILIVDDIYDTGNTLNSLRKMLEGYDNRLHFVTLTTNEKVTKPEAMGDRVYSCRDTNGEWVQFCWE